jgi:F-type H+-transporting ATPase subunit a
MAAFAPEIITHIGFFPVTNTFIHTLLVDGILLGTAFYLSKRLKSTPKGLQVIVEPVIEGLYSLTESIANSEKAVRAIFPIITTFFLFIFVSNFTGLLPGIGTIGFFSNEEFIPLLRGATSDINTTLGLAVTSVVATHVLSIQITGWKDYISRWFSFNPVNLYVGLLELVAEFTKIISLSFRLFGNIFAGEVALHTISSLFAFLAPLPFLLLESIVSVVQALVFSILTLVFMSVLTTPHHAHEHDPVSPSTNGFEGQREVKISYEH